MLNALQYEEGPKDIAVLIKNRDLNLDQIRSHYLHSIAGGDLNLSRVLVINLAYEDSGKAPVARCVRPHLEQVGKVVKKMGIKTVLCCDAHYFKTLTKVRKADPELGYPKDCVWDDVKAFYVPNYAATLYDTRVYSKIELAVRAVDDWLHQRENQFSGDILPEDPELYLASDERARFRLKDLLDEPVLTADIETAGLKIGSELLSISFAWNQREGIAISLRGDDSEGMRECVKEFFLQYRGKLIWHGGTFDVKQLIWHLFMKRPGDFENMLLGLEVFFDQIQYEDTMALTYLATNSTGGNDLNLKAQAFEYTGKYAIDDMENLVELDDEKILRYNLIDAVGTWFVHTKHRNTVLKEQEEVYQNLFLPSLKTITQMELIGLPLDMDRVLDSERELEEISSQLMEFIDHHPTIDKLNQLLREREAEKRNKTLKKLRKTADDFPDLYFNPGSPPQIQVLLHDILDLPVMNRTKTKQPATDADSLKGHIAYLENQRQDSDNAELLKSILGWSEVTKITNTFIKAMKENSHLCNNWHSLFGSFNLGGTKSGRLSSSNPNLQNLPSTGTKYAKVIKQCIRCAPPTRAEPGWLFGGADYLSLEDRIHALLTKDPNKLAVYIDGYDGHSLRAEAYFGSQMPDIQEELSAASDPSHRAEIINSIADRYPHLRQLSKGPTFALTYLGTYRTLVKNFGLSQQEAITIEEGYHELYKVADAWAENEIKFAHENGYVKLAFGLRLRTPLLPKLLWNHRESWPYQGQQERKTATNALGQSYGLLNSHTCNLFMQRVWTHPEYRYQIFPAAQIHDAQYFVFRNDLAVVKWINDNLIECMEWNELPEIQHDQVKLGAEFDIFYPDWSNPITLPNRASEKQIRQILTDALKETT